MMNKLFLNAHTQFSHCLVSRSHFLLRFLEQLCNTITLILVLKLSSAFNVLELSL